MADTTKATSSSKAADDNAKTDSKAAGTESGQKPAKEEGLPYVAGDVAAYDARARGDELEMSDRDAGASHLAANNQVPQEGALVTDPPQPVPPKDSGLKYQDESDEFSRPSKFPAARLTGHATPNEYPRDVQE